MLDTSTAGRAQLRSRSINVEANLLSQRINERARLNDQIRKKLAAVAVLSGAAILVVPQLYFWQIRQAKSSGVAAIAQAEIRRQMEEVESLQKSNQPKITEAKVGQRVQARSAGFMTNLTRFFNACGPTIAVISTKVDIVGGQLQISAKADAESYAAYQKFVERLQREAGPENVAPKSVRSSADLGPETVIFEIAYRSKLGGGS